MAQPIGQGSEVYANMLVKGYKRDGSWVYTEWKLTTQMNWRQIVHAMNVMVNAVNECTIFYGNTGCPLNDFTNEVKHANWDLVRAGLISKESDILKIRGIISNIPIDITMRNQAEFAQVTFLNDGIFPVEDYVAIPWLYDAFGETLNVIELIGHVNCAIDYTVAQQQKIEGQ